MYKTKLFDGKYWTDTQINEWFKENPKITILSTNSFSNSGWDTLFFTKKVIQNDMARFI